jgi:predicted O-linked N-acetylglucosamine transferase (SPINDLY family)
LSNQTDGNTEIMARKSDVFHRHEGSLAATARSIRNADLDVLVYPDIGMGPFSYLLAALRLAPVQCVSWGHPDTTGLPTIDYFLSSDLMEPAGSEIYYSEQLVRLPNLSIYYYPRSANSASQGGKKGRGHFGLPEDACIFLCSQATQKYLPAYDEIFPRIAEGVSCCRFVFIEHRVTESANRHFRTRLRAAFQRYGKDPDEYLHFLPWQSWPEYLALNEASDVFLDSIGWSGGNTTLEALAQRLPVVTLPGRFMRGRHSYAMLKRIGADACIANSLDHYVEIAVRLANDDVFYDDQVDIIRDGLRLLYRDRSAIEGLEAFYESLF